MNEPTDDPIAVVRARTHDALVELRAIDSRDAAATVAMHAVRLTAHTLEAFWMPSLGPPAAPHRDE